MNEEWLVYRRSEDFMPTLKMGRWVAMDAEGYDEWAKVTTQQERDRFPAIARGLTQAQAEKMVELTKEPE
jgi:hypothetical protein